jgi:transposase-like protein
MNLSELQEKFNTQEKCIVHLEKARWNGEPICPHCESDSITPRALKKKSNRGRKRKNPEKPRKTPMYHCNGCNKDFTVLMGTIFEGTKMPLQKWFMLISLMLNARKGISAMNIMRDLGITYKSAWFSAMRVRCAMLDQAYMLEGIVEMDESYFGGKPRKRNAPNHIANLGYKGMKTDDWVDRRKFNRGRGSDKVKVVGMVERGVAKGRVTLKVQDSLTSADLLKTLRRYVKLKKGDTTVMTDDFKSYKAFDKVISHYTVNHSQKQYVKHLKGIKDSIHTNTIEGVWSIIKNGIRGQYHVLSKKYLPFYLAEAAYKYNRRGKAEKAKAFQETISNAVTEEKCEVNYKPKAYPKFLAYRRKKKKA